MNISSNQEIVVVYLGIPVADDRKGQPRLSRYWARGGRARLRFALLFGMAGVQVEQLLHLRRELGIQRQDLFLHLTVLGELSSDGVSHKPGDELGVDTAISAAFGRRNHLRREGKGRLRVRVVRHLRVGLV